MQTEQIAPYIDLYGAELYRYCCRLTGRVPDAEDLYQQTFLRLLELPLTMDANNNPRALLYSIATGLFKNDARKKIRRAAITKPLELDGETPPVLADGQNTQAKAEQNALHAALRQAVANLPKKHQSIVLLYYQAGFSTAEIAKCEKLPEGTIKSRLHKARNILKQEMEAQGYDAI